MVLSITFMNVSVERVRYTLYPRCFKILSRYFVTARFITFSYLFFGPIAPKSSPPCPASITIVLFLAFLEVIF